MRLRTRMMCVLAIMIGVATSGLAQAPAVTFTDLHDVNANGGDMHNFNSGVLAQARDGNLYLEVQSGGGDNLGGVASFSPLGVMKTVFSFNGSNGVYPTGGLTLGTEGQLYGDAQHADQQSVCLQPNHEGMVREECYADSSPGHRRRSRE